jgi:hypothetical protein
MELKAVNPRCCAALREELIRQVERYFYGGDNRDHFPNIERENSYRIATLLDPRFKKAAFFHAINADLALLELVNLVQVELQKDAAADVQPEPEERDVDDFSDELDGNLLNSSFEVQPKRARMADDETS